MNIYEAITACIADIGAVGKNSKNQTQGWMFRGIDAVYNAINPALAKNKVCIVPTVLDMQREERTTSKGGNLIYSILKVQFTFYAEDGSSIDCVVFGEGMDSGDKSINKAMSIAYKYACFQVFCIPTEEMKDADPDNETHEVKAKAETKTTPGPSKTGKKATEKQIELVRKMADGNERDLIIAICESMGEKADEKWLEESDKAAYDSFIGKYAAHLTLDAASAFIKNHTKKED